MRLLPENSAPPRARPLGVFVADDSVVIRQRLAELVSSLDDVVIVGEASDVQSAAGGIQSTNPDVAIVDIRMPGGSGIDVLRQVRAARRESPAMIVYTHYGLPQYRKACSEAGADFFFDKATDGAELVNTLRTLAARR